MRRGFASTDPQRVKEIANMGGAAVHQRGTAHKYTREEARIYGAMGGAKSRGGGRKKREARS